MRIVIYAELEDEILRVANRTNKSASKIVNEAVKCVDLGSLRFIERAEMELKKGKAKRKDKKMT